MSASTGPALYDVQGPRGRRLTRLFSVVVLLVVVALAAVVIQRMAAQQQFSAERWGPLLNPANPYFSPIWKRIGTGLRATLVAAALAIVFALVLGTFAASVRMLAGRAGRIPLIAVMEVLRGLPVVFLIFMTYRMLPQWGVNVGPLPGPDGLWYLVIALTLYNSVIIAEILRAGVGALPRGQAEAAMALGLSRRQTMTMIQLPQAFRIMLPSLISQLVVVLKDTSLAALIGVYVELLRQANLIIADVSNPIQMYIVIGAIYVVINSMLSALATWTQRRMAAGRSTPAVTVPVVAAGETGRPAVEGTPV